MRTFLTCVIALALVSVIDAQPSNLPQPSADGLPSLLLLASSSAVTDAPFSAVEVVRSQQIYAPGNLTTQERQSRIFRDGSGRIRVERLNTSFGSGTLITIVDPVMGYIFELNPSTLLGIRTPIRDTSFSSSSPTQPRLSTSERNPLQVENTDLGSQQMNGVTVTGTRTTTTFGDDGHSAQSVREQWVSPDLHLAVLTTQNVSTGLQTTVQLTDLVRAEPDPELFHVPAGYLIRIWPAVSKPGI